MNAIDAEADVPELALAALKAAQLRTERSRFTQVLVRDRELVRESPDGTVVVLRVMPARRVVANRIKVRGS